MLTCLSVAWFASASVCLKSDLPLCLDSDIYASLCLSSDLLFCAFTQDMTVKGLEPEIQRLIAKHKAEVKKLKQVHEAELLESDERAAQRYVKMTEELRDQLAHEKEAAVARERELAKERWGQRMFSSFYIC